MALERKDVRFKLHPDQHALLTVVAEAEGKDIGDWCEGEILKILKDTVHRASVIASRASQLGFVGQNGETPGNGKAGA